MTEGRVVDPRDVVACDDLLIFQSDALADVMCDQLVVAGQDLHGDSVSLEFRQHLADIR